MKPFSIAILVYGDINSTRNALTEEKYKDLASAFIEAGFNVSSVLYSDEHMHVVYKTLGDVDGILVWINPVEQGHDRKLLDAMLVKLSNEGCFVSTHPDVILKMGTKEVLYKTKGIGWTGDTRMYSTRESFVEEFRKSLNKSGTKVLKRYRGNGGNGIFKIIKGPSGDGIIVIHARNSNESKFVSWTEFYDEFGSYIIQDGLLIEQDWNENLVNGMVRCYLCGGKVAGFGYQEINALYELQVNNSTIHIPPGKRYYFTENCGLFSDLKKAMEQTWVPELQRSESITNEMLPVIWDADFFINSINNTSVDNKYSLCEINVSSVSPFPPSAIKFMVEETGNRIRTKKSESDFVA